MPGDFIPDDPSDFVPDVPDFIPDSPAQWIAAPPRALSFDDQPIRARSDNVGSSGLPPALPGSSPTIGTVVAQTQLPAAYHSVMAAAHIPAAALDSIVGDLGKGQSRESLHQSLAQAEQDLAGIAPNDVGDRRALEHKIQGLRDALDNPASGIPETHAGAAGELVRKASVLSPLALPGHLARGAAALGLPGGGFAKAAIEGGEKTGSELIADPSTYLIPGHAGAAAMFLPQVAESLGTSVGELQAELEKSGWKLTPELGAKLGQTAVGAGFAALLGHGLMEGAAPRGVDQTAAVQKAHGELAPSLAALEEHGITPPAESGLDLSALIPKELKAEKPATALDDLNFLPKRERAPAWEGMKQAVRSFESQLEAPDGKYDQAAFEAAKAPFLERVDPEHRAALDEKLNGLFVSRGQGRIFLEDAKEMTAGMTPIEVVPDTKTGTQVEIYHSPVGSKQNAIFITRDVNGEITGAAKSTRGGYEYIVGGSNVMDLPGSAGPLYRITKAAGIESTKTTTPAGRGAQIKASAKGLDITGGHDLLSKGADFIPDAPAAGGTATGLEQEPGGEAARARGQVEGEPVRSGVSRTGSERGAPEDFVAIAPDNVPPGGPVVPGLEHGSEAGALLTKTPDQPVVPLAGYDRILEAREAAKAQPSLLQRLKDKLTPDALKAMLLQEEAPIFAAADEVSHAMGVPGKFDAESTPIPRDPRLMLPLLKNTGALARHDSIVLGRVQKAARSEGLLGYVTQYLDLLGGERRMSQAEAQLVQKQREAQLHGLASVIKRRTGGALGVESRLDRQLSTGQRPKMFKRAGGPMTFQERTNLAVKTLPRVRERLGALYAGERAAGHTPNMNRALAGKFVKARKAVEGLQKQLHGNEVHPLFTSSKDVADAFTQFEDALTPEQMTRVQELAAHVLDIHRRNLDLAYRPSSRYGGSSSGLLTEAQYSELKGRLVGPEGTEYAPLNRLLDQLEGGTGWAGGAGLTSAQRTWLQKYKTGSKNAPVDPFNAALASSMRLFSDLAHNAAADSIYELGKQGRLAGVDVGIRRLKGGEKPHPDEISLSVRKKGELIKFAAPADFGPALLAKAAPELTGLTLGTLRRARNLLREGVINLYPFFAISNVPVDFIDAQLLGRVHTTKLGKYNPAKYAVGVAHWVAALGDTIKESPEYMEALWHGALGSTFTHAARAERGATPLPGAPVGLGGAVKNVLEVVGQKTEEATKVYGFKESLRRLTELEKLGGKFTNDKELLAAYEAMKFVGTPDVMTHGHAIPEANVLLPFLNVGIQGTARMYRRFIRNPKEFLLPTLATVTATEAMLLAWNAQQDDGEGGRELDHVPQDEKDNYWSIILPETAFGRYPENGRLHRVKIRKPQPVRILAGPIRDLLAGAFTATNPDYVQTGINALTEAQPIPGLHVNPNKPVSSLASSAAAAQNPLVKLTLEQISNMDYLRGTPIERRAEQGRAPSERYDERTSPTAVVISQAITKAASYLDAMRGGMLDAQGNPREQLQDVVPGPKRIEHAVRTLTGGLGQMTMGILDPLASKISPQAPRAREPVEQIPVLNDLLRRLVTLAPRDSVREKLTDGFYDRFDQLDEVVKTYPVLMRTNPDRAAAFLRERGIAEFGQARGEYVAMMNASAALARMYKEARAVKTSAEAKQINDRINQLLKQVLQERTRRAAAAGPAVPAPGLPGLGKPPSASSMIDVADENFVPQ